MFPPGLNASYSGFHPMEDASADTQVVRSSDLTGRHRSGADASFAPCRTIDHLQTADGFQDWDRCERLDGPRQFRSNLLIRSRVRTSARGSQAPHSDFPVRNWHICKLKQSLPAPHLVLLARRDYRRMVWRMFR
ncbi:hypothetical protein BRAS3843_2900007 [Bradyrhizobium sp. STM 3843]|nr:hypothetical protein BRAS3843_2900007 [Bradyrhizobium sp. STM 3843]